MSRLWSPKHERLPRDAPRSLKLRGSGPDNRIDGVDLARALAFGGMLLAHFANSRPDDPAALAGLDNAANSWSGPLFCVLLGLGAGLIARDRSHERLLAKRGLALLAVGLALWPHVDHVLLILPHLGVLLVMAPLLRRIADQWLLPVAFVAFVVPSIITSLMDSHGLRGATQPTRYVEYLDVPGTMGNLFWSGGYPLAGWIGFMLVGLWLARRALGDARTLWTLAGAGFLISITQPLLDRAFGALDGRPHDPNAGGLPTFLDTSAHSNRTAWYVLACATVVAVTAVCILVTRRGRTVARPMVLLGQLALTAYLAHILLLDLVVWDWRRRSDPALILQFAVAGVAFLGFAALATLWRSRFRRGPLEAVLRRVTG